MTAPAATAPATTRAVATIDEPGLTPFQVIEQVITKGDLAQMTPAERVAFYWRTCESLGLNPLTRPFEFISLNGKLTMYARKDATDQLRKLNGVSVTGLRREQDAELGLVTVYASGIDKHGRTDQAEGVVSVKGLSGEALANAIMKASTKAKRRLTLSLVGLGFLDESEVEGAVADVDPTTGEIIDRPKPATLMESVNRQRAKLAEASTAETASEAPGADDVGAQLPESARTPAASEPQAETDQGITNAEFQVAIGEIRATPAMAMAKAKEMWPDWVPADGPLTGIQRADLVEALRTEKQEAALL